MSYTVKNAVEKLKAIYEESATKGGDLRLKEIIDSLESPDILLIEWSTEDIISRAKDLAEWGESGEGRYAQKIPTIEEAREMLITLDSTHDCNYGITWDHIDSVLSEMV